MSKFARILGAIVIAATLAGAPTAEAITPPPTAVPVSSTTGHPDWPTDLPDRTQDSYGESFAAPSPQSASADTTYRFKGYNSRYSISGVIVHGMVGKRLYAPAVHIEKRKTVITRVRGASGCAAFIPEHTKLAVTFTDYNPLILPITLTYKNGSDYGRDRRFWVGKCHAFALSGGKWNFKLSRYGGGKVT
jgi:hypothetical protein